MHIQLGRGSQTVGVNASAEDQNMGRSMELILTHAIENPGTHRVINTVQHANPNSVQYGDTRSFM